MSQDYKELSIEDKFAKSIHKLRMHRPFYSAVYEALKRVESDSVKTMGVNTTEMVYNPEFIESLEFSELMFVQLHEVAHVALMHVARCGDKQPKIWNIACDLYVNKLLATEFSVLPGNANSSESVKFPSNGLYCSSLDLDEDYAEKIYQELIEQVDKFKKSGPGRYKIIYKGSLYDKLYNSYVDKVKVTYSIFEMDIQIEDDGDVSFGDGGYSSDIIDTGKCQDELENETKQILSDASFRYEMSNPSGKDAGGGKGTLYKKVQDILKSKIDWVKILKRYCRQMRSSDLSYSNPDKRMFYQRAIYPGQSLESDNFLKDIKVCIDCSGSISDKDYSYFNGQIKDLLKSFKLEAELVYWDADIETCGNISNFKDYKDLGILGGGGTDARVIFEYFDSKKCKVKPYVTVILTDGYFPINFNKEAWKRKYKDTIWVLTKDGYKDFNPPFGKVVPVKYD